MVAIRHSLSLLFLKSVTILIFSFILLLANESLLADDITKIEKCFSKEINSLSVSGIFDIKIKIDTHSQPCIVLTSETRIINRIQFIVLDQKISVLAKNVISTKHKPNLDITLPNLKHFFSNGQIKAILFVPTQNSANLSFNGVSNISLIGNVNNVNLQSSGISKIHIEQLFSKKILLKVKGISDVYLRKGMNIHDTVIGGIINIHRTEY